MPLPPADAVHVHELDLTRPRADALTSAELRRAEQRGAQWANTRAALRETLARYIRDEVIAAMDGVRDVADRLERIVADDLWPLPRYSEILFIK